MNITTFPDELSTETVPSVHVFDYNSTRETAKQQIILNHHTFSFLTEGTKEVVFDNSSLHIDHSRFLIMKSGHCLMTEKLSDINNYRSVLLFFTNETLLKFIRKAEVKKTQPAAYQSVYAFGHTEFTHRFVNSLMDIAKLSEKTQRRLLEVKFQEIMLYLAETYGTEFLQALTQNSDDASQKFTRTVESNLLSKLTLKQLAFLCHMSVSTFKREFAKHYAESPIRWFKNKRLEYAYYLLNHKQKTSSEIYAEVGYDSLSSFIQAYKIKYGVTPKQHRKH